MTSNQLAPTVLTVAGSDSGGGAGIQADLRTFALHGVHGASVLAALTAQNTVGVQEVYPIEPSFVEAQLDSVFEDLNIVAVKTGLLGSPEVIEIVARRLERSRPHWLVVDPVMVATSGDRLLPEHSEAAVINRLAPLADLLTPNRFEAEVLLGRSFDSSQEALAGAAGELAERFGGAVLLKGGHGSGQASDDCLARADGTVRWYAAQRVATRHTHGTGCHLASAIAARLVRDEPLAEAVGGAKAWLTEGLRNAVAVGRGASPPRVEPT